MTTIVIDSSPEMDTTVDSQTVPMAINSPRSDSNPAPPPFLVVITPEDKANKSRPLNSSRLGSAKYIDSHIDRIFTCALCSGVLYSPVYHIQCERLFCQECVPRISDASLLTVPHPSQHKALAGELRCPDCPVARNGIRMVPMMLAPRHITVRLDELLVKCDRCTQVMRRDHFLYRHRSTTCVTPLPCPSGCGFELLPHNGMTEQQRAAVFVEHNKVCTHAPAPCRGCHQTFVRRDLLQHQCQCVGCLYIRQQEMELYVRRLQVDLEKVNDRVRRYKDKCREMRHRPSVKDASRPPTPSYKRLVAHQEARLHAIQAKREQQASTTTAAGQRERSILSTSSGGSSSDDHAVAPRPAPLRVEVIEILDDASDEDDDDDLTEDDDEEEAPAAQGQKSAVAMTDKSNVPWRSKRPSPRTLGVAKSMVESTQRRTHRSLYTAMSREAFEKQLLSTPIVTKTMGAAGLVARGADLDFYCAQRGTWFAAKVVPRRNTQADSHTRVNIKTGKRQMYVRVMYCSVVDGLWCDLDSPMMQPRHAFTVKPYKPNKGGFAGPDPRTATHPRLAT